MSQNFYKMLQALPVKPTRYPYYLLEVTSRCNANCQHCYYPIDNASTDPSIDKLVEEAKQTNLWPMLTGGEPTVRPDLPELVAELRKINRVCLLTNGLNLDRELIGKLLDAGLMNDGVMQVGLSLHSEQHVGRDFYAAKIRAIEAIRERGVKMAELMFTIEDVSEIADLLPVMRRFDNHVEQFRIRGAHSLWRSHRVKKTIYLAELYYTLSKLAEAESVDLRIDPDFDNTFYTLTVTYDGMRTRLISVPEKNAVVFGHLIGYGPFMRCHDGQVRNFVLACMFNDNFEKGAKKAKARRQHGH